MSVPVPAFDTVDLALPDAPTQPQTLTDEVTTRRPAPARLSLPRLPRRPGLFARIRRWLHEATDPRGWGVAAAERAIIDASIEAYVAEHAWHSTRMESGGREHLAAWKCAERDLERATSKLIRLLNGVRN